MNAFLKTTAAFFLSSILIASAAQAQTALKPEKNLSFSLTQYTSVQIGHQGEYVFCTNASGNKAKLSYLNWDIKPIIAEGLNFNLGIKKFNAEINLEVGIPGNSGNMQDYDWTNNESPDSLSQEEYNINTHYSIHENILSSYFSNSLFFSYELTETEKIHFTPTIGLEYSNYYFIAKNGYGYHPDDHIPYPRPDYHYGKYLKWDTKVISLRRHILNTWIGMKTKFDFSNIISWNLNLLITPYSVIYSFDNHYPSASYLDQMHGTLSSMKVEGGLKFQFNKASCISINASYLASEIIHGITASKVLSLQSKYYLNEKATSGCDFEYATFTISYTHKF